MSKLDKKKSALSTDSNLLKDPFPQPLYLPPPEALGERVIVKACA